MKEKNLIMNEPFPRVPSLCLTRGGGGVRRLYFVLKLEKGEKFRRENKDWCINLQFFSEKTTEKVKEMATVKYFSIIPCDKN